MRPHERRKALGQTISTERLVNRAVEQTPEQAFVPVHTFGDFAMHERLKEAVVARGYVTPTPIQDQVIPLALAGRDVLGLANTGTGKTAAFLIPIIDRLLRGEQGRALIVAPTRELATQIHEEFKLLGGRVQLRSALIVGGVSEGPQIQALVKSPPVVIGTPGRLKAMIQEGHLRLDRCFAFVLDEADRMVDMGFIHDVRFLIAQLPNERQSLFLSATLPPMVQGLVQSLLRDPVKVAVQKRETAEGIEQDVIEAGSLDEKLQILTELLTKPEFDKVLVFGRTKWGVQKLADKLERAGIKASAIHGNKSQPQRDRALEAFKSGRLHVLVATDVAARGLHIPEVTHVINFDMPQTYEDYVHRIGRTGRLDRVGKALTFVPKGSK
jgi:ATP-dependent RNA helicase RhlE